MFATWILCIFFVLIAPYLLVEAAVLRTRKCAQLGAPRGYRSRSMRVLPKRLGIMRRSFAACVICSAAS